MAIEYSTGLRNFLQNFGSLKQALTGGKMVIYTGSAPSSPDSAATGTALVTITLGSGAHTKATPARGSVTISVDGTVTGITVNGLQIMSGTVSAQGTVTATAAAVAANINAFCPTAATTAQHMMVRAWNVAGKVFLEANPQNGAVTWAVVSAGGATTADVNFGTERAGVASANGLTYGSSSSGAISKSGTWSGLIGTSGTAGYFRIYGPTADDTESATPLTDSSPYPCIRVQGTCGTSGADYNMSSTTLTAAQTHTVDTGSVTLNEEV